MSSASIRLARRLAIVQARLDAVEDRLARLERGLHDTQRDDEVLALLRRVADGMDSLARTMRDPR